jgi:hypothetical protein
MHRVGAIPFVFGLLLLMPKIGGQEQIFLILTMPRTPSTKLGNSKCGQGQKKISQPYFWHLE